MTQRGWFAPRLGDRWLSTGFPYHQCAPRKITGSVVVDILLLPFTFLLEKSAEADITTTPGTIAWRGVATCPGFTADYLVVQGYDQTLGENPRQRVEFKITVGVGQSALLDLGVVGGYPSGWADSNLVFSGFTVVFNSIVAGVVHEPGLRPVPWSNYP